MELRALIRTLLTTTKFTRKLRSQRRRAPLIRLFNVYYPVRMLALGLAGIGWFFPRLLPGNNASLIGLIFLTFGLFGWRTAYSWLVQQRVMQEKVYVLGTGERAQRLVQGLRRRKDLGIDVIGWS